MQTYEQLLDQIAGPPRHGEDHDWIAVESRAWNRRQFILARRALPLRKRQAFDELVRFALARSIAVWSGSITLSYVDLVELVEQGWACRPEG